MINRGYFKEIGLEVHADEFADDELTENTVTIRLPKKVFEKIQLAMEWRSLSFQQHAERELFVLAIHQKVPNADSISKELIEKRDRILRENLTEAEYKRLKLREDYDLPKRPKREKKNQPS
jgi:hypothetical protein